MDLFEWYLEAARIVKRKLVVRKRGFKKYKGDAGKICNQIIKDCWNGSYFTTSLGNFSQFWTRDFGYCCKSLLNLGYREGVLKTLEYAIGIFERYDRVTTTINPHNRPLDIFDYSPDSLPLLLRTLRISDANGLIRKHKKFLEREIQKYVETVIDKETKIVKQNKAFSSIKDNSIRSSSLYDNCMVALLSKELDNLKLKNPLRGINYEQLITEKFWRGDYFLQDISGDIAISGDANVFPFWTETINSKEKLGKCIQKIKEEGLDTPFPLKYSKIKKGKYYLVSRIFTPNYEGTSIWMHLGLIYIKQVMKVDKNQARKYLSGYEQLIKKYHNFLEVFNPDGTPYKSLVYIADEGMLWASMYLDLVRNIGKG